MISALCQTPGERQLRMILPRREVGAVGEALTVLVWGKLCKKAQEQRPDAGGGDPYAFILKDKVIPNTEPLNEKRIQ